MATVWVLGAGFSAPLGGPLLTDLLSPGLVRHLQASFGDEIDSWLGGEATTAVLETFAYGSRYRFGRTARAHGHEGESLWGDAEQFLDYVETAAAGGSESPAFRKLRDLTRSLGFEAAHAEYVRTEGKSFAARAKQLMAANCAAFLRGADLQSERWDPYVRWARHLPPADTVITFNYDCVPELLATHSKKLVVLDANSSLDVTRAWVLKLHGSVNWCLKDDGAEGPSIMPHPDQEHAVKCDPKEIALAGPGPLKRVFSSWLGPLWNEACHRLEVADAVVFLGYRFPQTDANARRRLLTAIAENSRPYLALHTVLGPDSADGRRLTQLLRAQMFKRGDAGRLVSKPTSSGWYNLVTHSLWVEDFLSVFPLGLVENAFQIG